MGVCGVGPHCSFCGTFTGPFSELQGLFTVLICIPCLEVHLAQPDTLLGLHDPGQPWEKWGCPIKDCGRWVIGPWELEGHTAAEHPGWARWTSRHGMQISTVNRPWSSLNGPVKVRRRNSAAPLRTLPFERVFD